MKNKFEIIHPWISIVLEAIKKDIKTDFLPGKASFIRAHFGNRPTHRLTIEEIFEACAKDLLAGDEEFSEWVVNRWVFRHGDIYSHFAERLGKISQDYSAIRQLSEEESDGVLEGAAQKFGALPLYLFSVLNGVVFPETVFARLRSAAEEEEARLLEQKEEARESQRKVQAEQDYRRELARLQEKYEGKVSGVMKKYGTDVDALKKQIRSLQKQVEELKRAPAPYEDTLRRL